MNKAAQEILPPEEAINLPTTVDYDITNEAIEVLAKKYKGMTADNTEEYQAVVKGIAEMRGLRIQVEEMRKEKGVKAREYVSLVNDEAGRITELMSPIEGSLKEVKQVVDDRKAEEKAAKEREEQERVDGLLARIDEIKNIPLQLIGKDITEIIKAFELLGDMVIDESFQECAGRAGIARAEALDQVNNMRNEHARLEKEAEHQRILAEEREKNAKLEQEKLAEERAKIAKEEAERQKEREAERQAAEKIKKEADERAAKLKEQEEAVAKEKADLELQRKEMEEKAKAQAEKPAPEPAPAPVATEGNEKEVQPIGFLVNEIDMLFQRHMMDEDDYSITWDKTSIRIDFEGGE